MFAVFNLLSSKRLTEITARNRILILRFLPADYLQQKHAQGPHILLLTIIAFPLDHFRCQIVILSVKQHFLLFLPKLAEGIRGKRGQFNLRIEHMSRAKVSVDLAQMMRVL